MSQYYLPKSSKLSLTHDHDFSRPTVPCEYEIIGCWNCGSEGWVSLPNGQGGHEAQECRICSSIGEIPTSVEFFEISDEWLTGFPAYDLFVVSSPIPLFFPGP